MTVAFVCCRPSLIGKAFCPALGKTAWLRGLSCVCLVSLAGQSCPQETCCWYGLVSPLGTRPQGGADTCCCPGCPQRHSQTSLVSGQRSVLHGNMVTRLLVCTVLSVCGVKAESEAWRWGRRKAAVFVVQYGALSAGDIPV